MKSGNVKARTLAFFAYCKINLVVWNCFVVLRKQKRKNMKTENKSYQFINDQIAESLKDWCLKNQDLLNKKTDDKITIAKHKDLIKRQDKMLYEMSLDTVTNWENRSKSSENNESSNFIEYVCVISFVISFLSFIGVASLILNK